MYLSFCEHFQLVPFPADQSTISLLVTFYTYRFRSHQTLLNHISGIRTLCKERGVTFEALNSYHTKIMIRAAKYIMDKPVKRATPISVNLLEALCTAARSMYPTIHPILRVAMIFSWFGLLRASNIAPPTHTSFSPRYHTCRADIFPTSKSITLLIKWAKNIQHISDSHLVILPSLPSTPICPKAAYTDLCTLVPTTSPNQPLLSFPPTFPTPHPIVTYPYLTQCLRSLLTHLHHDPSLYSWHSFRRGGAATAFQANIPLHLIKQQGAWRSKAILTYTSSLNTHSSSYAQPLISHVLHSLS